MDEVSTNCKKILDVAPSISFHTSMQVCNSSFMPVSEYASMKLHVNKQVFMYVITCM